MSRMMGEAISALLVGPSLDLSCVMRSQPHEYHDKEIDDFWHDKSFHMSFHT